MENQHKHMDTGISPYHSVKLYEERCKGCTVCVTSCPAEAIRVRGGKAHILDERCIDCGECIRRCQSKAKYASSPDISVLSNFDRTTVLIPPAFYTQFSEIYTVSEIHTALKKIGFTYTADVAEDALAISQRTAQFLKENKTTPRPVISSSCPAVTKLIQIRFPALIDNILPLIPPVEHAARRMRTALSDKPGTHGIFFISPCPAKMTAVRVPVGYEPSQIDGAFSIGSIYLPVLSILRRLTEENDADAAQQTHIELSPGAVWCRETGEAHCVSRCMSTPPQWLSASGIEQVIETLEAIEDGQLDTYDFVELDACTGGCVGGPLMTHSVPQANTIARARLRPCSSIPEAKAAVIPPPESSPADVRFNEEIVPRPARRLSENFAEARKRMERIEQIAETLPGLDCGSCGAPNCRALAEDIVCGSARLEDCIVIMKQKYEEYLFGNNSAPEHDPKQF